MKKSTADYWAPRIHAEWRKSLEGILGVGRQLFAAKEACEHGEFMRLFKGSEGAISNPVPFGISAADKLLLIARHPVISNSEFVPNLPPSWATLYELTKLDAEQIIAGIKAGEITPDMTRSQALALRADPVDNRRVVPADAAEGMVKLPRWIAAMSRWVDSESARFALGAVAVESDGFNATAVATDGRRMAVVTVPQTRGDERRPYVEQFLIPADALAKAIKQVPPRFKPGSRIADANGDGSERFVTVEAHGDGTATVAAADGNGTPVTIDLHCEGRYPAWRDVVGRAAADTSTAPSLNCNPKYLADVSALAVAAGAVSMSVRFNAAPSLFGEFTTIDGSTGRVIVMGQDRDEQERHNAGEKQRLEIVRYHAQRGAAAEVAAAAS